MRIVVYHAEYDCESGCCGHYVEVDGKAARFHFEHPYKESRKAFVRRIVTEQCGAEHVADIDWDACHVEDD